MSSAAGYQSPLSTLSRSSKYRIPSPSGTTTNSSGASTNHSSSSISSRNSSPATNNASQEEKTDVLILDDDSDYDDEPVTQAPQLSALARMLLSESPKSTAKSPAPPTPAPPPRQQQAPFTTKPRQKLSWGTTSTEYIKKEDTDGDSLPKEDGPSQAAYGSFVTPAPRISRTIRPFTGTSYYTSTTPADGYTDATMGDGKDMGGVTATHAVPESAVRPQLGSAARWKSTGRGFMSGLAGAPRRGAIRRGSSDQEDKERLDEASPEQADYGRESLESSPLQRASKAQYDEESKRDRDIEPKEFSLSRSRGSTPEAANTSQRRESWSSRRATTTPEQPRAASPELELDPMEVDSPHQSPTPKPSEPRPTYSRFSRRAPSLSRSGSGSGGSAASLRSSSARDLDTPSSVAGPAIQQQQSSQGQDKENNLFSSSRRSVAIPTKPTLPSPVSAKADVDPPPPRPPSAPPRSTTPSKPAPKMAPLVGSSQAHSSARTPSPDAPQRRDILANRDRNTPHRPAPPPPKMSMVNTVTAAAGAQSSRKRGQVIINGRQYRRLDAIGKGGSSKVYKVMAENFRVFAMKKVTFSDEEDGQAAILGYKGEIELLKKLEKVDRVIRLFDYEVNDAKGYLIMLMECGEADLAKLLQSHYSSENARFDISFTRHYWREMLLCVQAVHALNIIHSDLKPANFLVVQGRLKLIDFGIANAIVGDTVNVHRESQVGTVNYMSPEALTDVNATPTGRAVQGVGSSRLMKLGAPSDVWSLGCILYQMVYGRAPFSHLTSIYQKLAAIPNPRHEIAYPEVGIGETEVPWSVIHTLQDCLERDKDERVTIEELLSDSNGFLNPEISKRRRGEVGITEEMLRRVMENAVEYTVRSGGDPGREVVRGWARSVFSKLEIQEGRRRPRGEKGDSGSGKEGRLGLERSTSGAGGGRKS